MSVVDQAIDDAAAAAHAAGVVIEPVADPDELDVLRATMHEVWGPEIVPPRNLLRGLALGGACLLVARHAGRPIGFALGWLGWDGGVHLHSHQVGVVGEYRRGGCGYALKLAQRAMALANGVSEMRWTYDPLLRANAAFNLVRLGATPIGFHPHCYGDRTDAFNTGERTDRLEVAWQLDRPIGGATTVPGDDDELIPIPTDYQALRHADPEMAKQVRDLTGALVGRTFAMGRTLGWCNAGYVAIDRGPAS